MDEEFDLPHFASSLDDVPEEWRDCYQPYKTGEKAFILDNFLWTQVVVPARQKIGELQSKIRDLSERYDRDLASERNEANRERAERGLSAALVEAGVRPGLVAGAKALLMQLTKFEVERNYADDGYVVMADTGAGLFSVEHLVAHFLDSDEGRAFQSRDRAVAKASDSRFSSMIAEMRRSR